MKMSVFHIIPVTLALMAISCQGNTQTKTEKSNDMTHTFDALKDSLQGKNIKEVKTSFTLNGKEHDAYISYNGSQLGKRPGIIVVPEWWGLNNYIRERGKMFANLGYVAMSIDPFGNGTIANNPQEATAATKPYYENPALCKELVDKAIEKLKTNDLVDTSDLALTGYCFGGFTAINAGILGAPVRAVAVFHPSLGVAQPQPGIKAKFLICSGSADEFEKNNVQPFEQKMNAAKIDYQFNSYPDAKHGYTNPGATANGEKFKIPIGYNAEADGASWQDMRSFFQRVLAN